MGHGNVHRSQNERAASAQAVVESLEESFGCEPDEETHQARKQTQLQPLGAGKKRFIPRML